MPAAAHDVRYFASRPLVHKCKYLDRARAKSAKCTGSIAKEPRLPACHEQYEPILFGPIAPAPRTTTQLRKFVERHGDIRNVTLRLDLRQIQRRHRKKESP